MASADPLAMPLEKLVVGPGAKILEKSLLLTNVGELLRHYPRRYDKRGELTELARLHVDDDVTVIAEVAKVSRRPMRGRRGNMVEVEVTDGTSSLTLVFFKEWSARELKPGRVGLFAGKVGEFRGRRQLAHPEYQLLGDDTIDDDEAIDEFAAALIPIYPATSSLPSWKIAKCVETVLGFINAEKLPDPLPVEVRARHGLIGLNEALRKVHQPQDWGEVNAARKRLTWDEAFVLQVVLAQRRRAAGALPAVARVARAQGLLADFDARLPFELTAGQKEVGAAIEEDLARDHPMHRLLQGEVGSGKTLIALRGMLTVVDAGGQAVLLAPTEVLAQQHHRSIVELLGPLAAGGMLGGAEHATRVALITGSQPAKERRAALLDAASGDAGIVIGTHAVIEEAVKFFDLGLVVVDEQHRFGVEQRDALRGKAQQPPHVLVMTATPIPRTVAMTVFGDLDVSTLTELPRGRSPIATHVVPSLEKPAFLDRTWVRIREEVAAGHQAYVVCPRIGDDEPGEDTDEMEPADDVPEGRRPPIAVLDTVTKLTDGPLAGLRVAALHGRMPSDDKDSVMRAFAAGELDVLVSTTVIEVGVNVPNATVMVVLDADRFGVSQLHQLRGRVGRGSAPGLCLLVTEAVAETPARERLDAVAGTLDGFRLSEIDLEQRREGDVLGASQSGRRSSLRMLAVMRDKDVIEAARHDATTLVAEDPALTTHPTLAAAVATLLDPERAEFLEKS